MRPYLDLGHFEIGPLHVHCVEEGWRAFNDSKSAEFVPQRAMPPGFRIQLAESAGQPYALTDPRELPEHLRTDRWRNLCYALTNWSDLSGSQKCRLASLLHSMCLYHPVLALIPEAGFEAGDADPEKIELAFWRASANFLHKQLKRTSHYEAADMVVFKDIALNARDAAPVRFNATAKILVHKAKTGAEVSDLVDWGKRFEEALAHAIGHMDEFSAALHTSRFYRGLGFLPQLKGDRSEVVRLMDLAEHHARKMTPATRDQELLYNENLHALMESRTKEALWLGDKDLALARSLRVVAVDPFDSKAWAELGQVRYLREEWQEASQTYAIAGMLGPPASAVGRHMAGLCLRKLGLDLFSAFFFKDTLEIDPLGISSREEIRNLPDVGVLKGLRQWSDDTNPL